MYNTLYEQQASSTQLLSHRNSRKTLEYAAMVPLLYWYITREQIKAKDETKITASEVKCMRQTGK
jgi:hypothetical protein